MLVSLSPLLVLLLVLVVLQALSMQSDTVVIHEVVQVSASWLGEKGAMQADCPHYQLHP